MIPPAFAARAGFQNRYDGATRALGPRRVRGGAARGRSRNSYPAEIVEPVAPFPAFAAVLPPGRCSTCRFLPNAAATVGRPGGFASAGVVLGARVSGSGPRRYAREPRASRPGSRTHSGPSVRVYLRLNSRRRTRDSGRDRGSASHPGGTRSPLISTIERRRRGDALERRPGGPVSRGSRSIAWPALHREPPAFAQPRSGPALRLESGIPSRAAISACVPSPQRQSP